MLEAGQEVINHGAEQENKKISWDVEFISGGIGRKGICHPADNFQLGDRGIT